MTYFTLSSAFSLWYSLAASLALTSFNSTFIISIYTTINDTLIHQLLYLLLYEDLLQYLSCAFFHHKILVLEVFKLPNSLRVILEECENDFLEVSEEVGERREGGMEEEERDDHMLLTLLLLVESAAALLNLLQLSYSSCLLKLTLININNY